MFKIAKELLSTTFATRTDITLGELLFNKLIIDFSPEEYQRFFRASVRWQRALMVSFFTNSPDEPILIPEIALRYQVKDDGSVHIEVMDGCQRTTTAINFMLGLFVLPNKPAISGFELDGKVYNLVGMSFKDIKIKYPDVATWLENRTIHCQIYVNISDAHAAHVFVNVLNNSNALTDQEKRNATRSFLARFVRKISRTQSHDLFELEANEVDCKKVKVSHKKMGVDQMIAELATMMVFGPHDLGTTSSKVDKLYEDERFIKKFGYTTAIEKTLKIALSGIDRNHALKETFTPKVLRNYLYIVNEMDKMNYRVNADKFMALYGMAHSKLKLITAAEKKAHPTFTKSDYAIHMSNNVHKDNKAALDMLMIKMMELSDGTEFGSVDPKRFYTKEEVAIMATVQNNICLRCDKELGDDPVGAHGYSWTQGSLTITGEGYAAHKYCNWEEGKGVAA
ncbi:uncharacterized protein METZ01_LOCUS164916 [marine metagenome]|uniref:DUF262 domain-containing protein n=1 Tax=marine metagenome TaxID=408172 RepID=A0A382BFL6_9ZZZZ